MKWHLVCLLMASHSVLAAGISTNVAYSCLTGKAFSDAIKVVELPSNEVSSDDDFRPGYSATYLIKFNGHDVGYAQSKKGDALIYGARLYPLYSASNIPKHKAFKPTAFTPELAEWSSIEESSFKYLCVNFNFDGLGRSGSFQNVHGAYVLPTKSSSKLYYLMGDVRILSGDK